MRPTLVETAAAYGRLLEYSSNKRYGLIDNYLLDSGIDALALEFNKEIKAKSKLDILELEEYQLISEYEDIVDQLLTDFTYRYIISATESDEGKLLQTSYEIGIDFLRRISLSTDTTLRENLAHSPLTIPELISLIKNCHASFACNFGEEKPQELFINTTKRLRGQEKLIYVHISNIINRNVPSEEKWTIDAIGIFSKPEFLQHFNQPVELFLKILDHYGLEININDTIKKYFYKMTFPRTHRMEDFKFTFAEEPKEPAFISFKVLPTHLGWYVRSGFSLLQERLLKDSSIGAI